MPYYCVLCKKEPIPGDKSRSFHKFPDDDDLKGKWMSLVGINSVTKYTKLCSDHFDMSAYEDCNGHTTKRCLLKTAVPCRLLCTDKIQSGSYSVVKGQTQLNLQEQQCSSNVCENNVIDVLPSINNDLSTNTNRAFNKKKENFGELSNSIVSDSCVAVDCHTTSDLSKSSSVTVVLDTSNNLSKTHCASILKNNPCTQMLKEQVMQKTLFSNAQCNDDYTNLKRSLPDTNSSKNSDVSLSKKICPSNVLDLSLPDSNCSESSDVSPSEKMCPSNIFESNRAKNLSNHLESNEAGKNVKRHMSYIDISDIPPTKKFRFFDGPQPMCISRKDFATDEAWSRFLKFTIYKKRQAESCRKKNQRKSKQIGNIKELVSILREENATAAADYLQTSDPTPESSQLQQVEALTKLPETSGPTPESSQTQLVEALAKLPEAEEIILNVYNYLKTEYDRLKSVAGDSCDLSPLANILKRTAQATGVNEPTVTAILQGNKRERPGERLKTSGKKRRKRRREVENVDLSPIEEDSDFKTTDDEQHANDDIEQMAQEHVGIETVKLEIHEEDIEHSVAMREAMMSNMEFVTSGENPTVQLVMSPPYFEIKTEPVDVEISRQPQHCVAVDPLTLDTQLGDVELPAQHAPPDPGQMDSAGSSTRDRLIVTTTYNC